MAEVTLITDKDQAIPVQVVRNGLRSVVFGLGNGQHFFRRGFARKQIVELAHGQGAVFLLG